MRNQRVQHRPSRDFLALPEDGFVDQVRVRENRDSARAVDDIDDIQHARFFPLDGKVFVLAHQQFCLAPVLCVAFLRQYVENPFFLQIRQRDFMIANGQHFIHRHGVSALVQATDGLGIRFFLALHDQARLFDELRRRPVAAEAKEVHILNIGFAGEFHAADQADTPLGSIGGDLPNRSVRKDDSFRRNHVVIRQRQHADAARGCVFNEFIRRVVSVRADGMGVQFAFVRRFCHA